MDSRGGGLIVGHPHRIGRILRGRLLFARYVVVCRGHRLLVCHGSHCVFLLTVPALLPSLESVSIPLVSAPPVYAQSLSMVNAPQLILIFDPHRGKPGMKQANKRRSRSQRHNNPSFGNTGGVQFGRPLKCTSFDVSAITNFGHV